MRIPILATTALFAAGALFAADLPRPSPDFAVQVPGGKQVKVSDYTGKVVCLAFILTT